MIEAYIQRDDLFGATLATAAAVVDDLWRSRDPSVRHAIERACRPGGGLYVSVTLSASPVVAVVTVRPDGHVEELPAHTGDRFVAHVQSAVRCAEEGLGRLSPGAKHAIEEARTRGGSLVLSCGLWPTPPMASLDMVSPDRQHVAHMLGLRWQTPEEQAAMGADGTPHGH
jgi:hypothetical protein